MKQAPIQGKLDTRKLARRQAREVFGQPGAGRQCRPWQDRKREANRRACRGSKAPD